MTTLGLYHKIPKLTKKFEFHLNEEFRILQVRDVKYLFKYVRTLHYQITVELIENSGNHRYGEIWYFQDGDIVCLGGSVAALHIWHSR